MYSAAQHEPDWRWTQVKLIAFLSHKPLRIRSTALKALGELILFRGQFDLELVLPAVSALAAEPALSQLVKDCLEDIKSRTTLH